MTNYSAPGIYVEEVSTGSKPIEAVGTSTAGFVGKAPNGTVETNKAVAINNWSQFKKEFVADSNESTSLSHAVYGFFLNGGSRCYVVNVGDGQVSTGLDVLKQYDEIAIVAAPGCVDPASYDALISHCENLSDRVAILDGPKRVSNINGLKKVAIVKSPTGGTPTQPSTDGTPTQPPTDGTPTQPPTGGTPTQPPTGGTPTQPPTGGAPILANESTVSGLRPKDSDKGYGAFYFPWIIVSDPLARSNQVEVPPSGHLAGVWARTDATRGVHKAPANESIRGALGVTYRVTRSEQEVLNPAGVNCIRFFPREGIRVWGARTLASSSSEWRYINVRRLFNMIKESIAEGTRWVVFEPNDFTLWKSIRRDVTAFLTGLWRDGMLMGRTAEEAFFVKCDEETNTPERIKAGEVVTEIGIAPVRPAEFIIFRLGQYEGGTEINSQEGG